MLGPFCPNISVFPFRPFGRGRRPATVRLSNKERWEVSELQSDRRAASEFYPRPPAASAGGRVWRFDCRTRFDS
jgi:hypothetical protein